MPDLEAKLAADVCQRNRDLSLFDSQPLCGMVVRPISIRTYVLLKQCGSRFILGGAPTAADVAMFLWFHSPDYSLDRKARERFMKSIRRLLKPALFVRCAVEINRFLAAAFMDGPGDSLLSYAGTVPGLIDLLAQQYGWSDGQIMDLPIARIFLYRLTILKRLMAEDPAA